MKKLPILLATGLAGVVAAGAITFQSAAADDDFAKREEKVGTQVTTVDDVDDDDADDAADVTRDDAGNDTVTNGTGVTRATKDNTRDNTRDNTKDDITNDRTRD